MSWKSQLSRHLPILRFFACGESPSSRGIIQFYEKNYAELKALNPCMELLLRTSYNASPAIVTDIDFTTKDLIQYAIQYGKFRNEDGTIATDRVSAAKAYLKTDWELLKRERYACKGFDPLKPFLEEDHPNWREDPDITKDLAVWLEAKDQVDHLEKVMKGGPNKEWERVNNELLMCQRVDLWCAGEAEVEMAVRHLMSLGRRFNNLEHDTQDYITNFYPGISEFESND